MSATQDHNDATAQDNTSTEHNTSSEDGASSIDELPTEDSVSTTQEASSEDSNDASSTQNSLSTKDSSSQEEHNPEVDPVAPQAPSSAIDTAPAQEAPEIDLPSQDEPDAEIDTAPTQEAPEIDLPSQDEPGVEIDTAPTQELLPEIDSPSQDEPGSEIDTVPTQELLPEIDSSGQGEPGSEIDTVPTQELLSEVDLLDQDKHRSEIDTVPTQELLSESDVLAEDTIVSKGDETTGGSSQQIRYVPYPRNTFFSGREDVLQQLHKELTTQEEGTAVQPLVINGLSGMGKTQVALEYIYRYQQDYRHILWINAATEQTLLADYIAIADTIGLPPTDQSLQEIAAAIRVWLAGQRSWLMVFDNVNDFGALQYYVPQEQAGRRTLYITNIPPASKIAHVIELSVLDAEQGVDLLLRRSKTHTPEDRLEQASSDEQTGASAIVNALDKFPFAIALAASYIEATGCDFARYLKLYEKQCRTISERGKYIPTLHAEPAMATSLLFFRSLEQDYPTALQLLCLCAFLATDTIPEDLIIRGAPILGPMLSPVAFDTTALKQAIEILCRFSLMQRYGDGKWLSIHPLVQTILKHEINRKAQREWAERAIATIDEAFPAEKISWQAYQPYIHQVQACALLIDAYRISSFAASKLLNNAALALKEHKQYDQAGPLFERALVIEEQIAGPEHPTTAITLNNLATLYHAQGNHERAESCYLRALAIWELEPGLEYPSLSVGYDNLALLYQVQGKYERVEAVRQHALAITEQVWGMVAPETANCFNNLANLYHTQGKYEEAETFYRRSLAILLKVVGTDHAATATSLNNLANLYRNWDKDQQAGPLLHRALLIREKVLGPDHLETASSLSDLGNLYLDWGRYQQAEQYLLRALATVEKVLGTQHTQVAFTLFHLAKCYVAQGKDEQAEALFQRILAIDEHIYGPNHSIVATDLENYADFLLRLQRQEEAKPLQERAQAIRAQQHVNHDNANEQIK